jgi:hypothetical protein
LGFASSFKVEILRVDKVFLGLKGYEENRFYAKCQENLTVNVYSGNLQKPLLDRWPHLGAICLSASTFFIVIDPDL